MGYLPTYTLQQMCSYQFCETGNVAVQGSCYPYARTKPKRIKSTNKRQTKKKLNQRKSCQSKDIKRRGREIFLCLIRLIGLGICTHWALIGLNKILPHFSLARSKVDIRDFWQSKLIIFVGEHVLYKRLLWQFEGLPNQKQMGAHTI